MLDVPGGTYWEHWGDVRRPRSSSDRGYVSPEDDHLFCVTDTIETAVDEVLGFYANYHSQRFVDGRLVLRMRHAPSPDELAALNRDFADIVVRGEIEVIDATPDEIADDDHVDLARVAFRFDRHGWARLRMLIDRLNGRSGARVSQVTYDFAGRVAVVTGAAAGIGRASALAFARAARRWSSPTSTRPAARETVDAGARRRRRRSVRRAPTWRRATRCSRWSTPPSTRTDGSTTRTTTPASPPRSTTSPTSPRRSGTACRA